MWIDYRALRRQIPIRFVLELLSYQPTSRRGSQLRGPCPFQAADLSSPRCFSVDLAKGRFRCFHCGAQGNHLDLWARVRNLSLHQAALDLCGRAGVAVPLVEPTSNDE